MGGGGVPGQRVVVEGVKEFKKALQAARNVQKLRKNGRFNALIDLKNRRKRHFLFKST
jgi:hypothetical protein